MGRSQLNLSAIQASGSYPFINHLKAAQGWQLASGTPNTPLPNALDTDGYPTSLAAACSTRCYIPTQSQRPGNYKVMWDGDGAISGTGGSVVSGSLSGVNGSAVIAPNASNEDVSGKQVNLAISSTNAANHVRNIRYFHVDDEVLLNGGAIFNTKFLDKLRALYLKVIRFLDWQSEISVNKSNVTTWARQNKPESFFSYGGNQFLAELYAGVTTNSGDDYSITFGTGGPADKQVIHVLFNAAASGVSPTLNLNGTGAVAIKDYSGNTMDVSLKVMARTATLIYDADLNCWLKFGGDFATFNHGIDNGVPMSVCIALCNELGVDPWFTVPYLACDPATDWMTGCATLCRDTGWSGMKPRFEVVPNELWNSQGAFFGTPYANKKALVHWPAGGSGNYNNWVGKVASVNAKAVADVYGGSPRDTSKYWTVVGVQQVASNDVAASNSRLASASHVADGGIAAYNYVTHIAPACYWGTSLKPEEEVALAYSFSLAGEDTQSAMAEEYVASALVAQNSGIGPVPTKLISFTAWKNWAAGPWGASIVVGISAYEGGLSLDYPINSGGAPINSTSPITGATKAAQCVLTLATTSAPNLSTTSVGNGAVVGMQVSIAGVGGMTQLNGNTYDVVAVNGNSVTINVDSTGFSTFTTGGTATYVGDGLRRTAFRTAAKYTETAGRAAAGFYKELVAIGVENPSHFNLCFPGQAWGLMDSVYAENSPQFEAVARFNAGRFRIQMETT